MLPMVNLAVSVSPAAVVTERPKPSPSEAPKLSIKATCGMCPISPCLTSLLHITPDETMVIRLDMSNRPGFSSSTLSIGLAKASPTIAIDRSEEHTSELQSLMRTSYAVFCLKKKKTKHTSTTNLNRQNKNEP